MAEWNITSKGLAKVADQVLGKNISEAKDPQIKAESYPSDVSGYISIYYDGDNRVRVTHVADEFVPKSPIDTGARYSKVVDEITEMSPKTLEAEIKEKIKDVYDFARSNS